MSHLATEVEVLRRVPLFQGLDPPKLKLLAFTASAMRFRPQEVIFRQGSPSDSAYVILAGEAAVEIDTPAGPIEIARLGETDFVGEIGVLADVPRSATVRAMSDLKTLRIGKECLIEHLQHFPSMSLVMLREIAMRLNRTTAELARQRAEAES